MLDSLGCRIKYIAHWWRVLIGRLEYCNYIALSRCILLSGATNSHRSSETVVHLSQTSRQSSYYDPLTVTDPGRVHEAVNEHGFSVFSPIFTCDSSTHGCHGMQHFFQTNGVIMTKNEEAFVSSSSHVLKWKLKNSSKDWSTYQKWTQWKIHENQITM